MNQNIQANGNFKIDTTSRTNKSFKVNKIPYNIIRKKTLSPLARKIKRQLKQYFEGQLKQFDIPLLMKGGNFQKKVWRSLQKIPYGQTRTYSELAGQLGSPKGSRAVGGCCGKNPFLIVVPCHRVVAKNGLGGFALGLKAKKQLLSLEQNSKR